VPKHQGPAPEATCPAHRLPPCRALPRFLCPLPFRTGAGLLGTTQVLPDSSYSVQALQVASEIPAITRRCPYARGSGEPTHEILIGAKCLRAERCTLQRSRGRASHTE
jgi:hypothetical protein